MQQFYSEQLLLLITCQTFFKFILVFISMPLLMQIVLRLSVSSTGKMSRADLVAYRWWERSFLTVMKRGTIDLNNAMVLQDTAGVWTVAGRKERVPAPHLELHKLTVMPQVIKSKETKF